tara:strand:- start:1079 stop:1465 length:387 start_codon:yes stop_codon:yes gene_type:complete
MEQDNATDPLRDWWKARGAAPAPVERVEQEAVGEIIQIDERRFINMDDDTLNSLPVGTKLYTSPQPAPTAAQDMAGLVSEAQFLLDRLSDMEQCLVDDDLCREYQGHVVPSAERLRMLLDAHQSGGAE